MKVVDFKQYITSSHIDLDKSPGVELLNQAITENFLNTIHGLNDEEYKTATEQYIKYLEQFYLENKWYILYLVYFGLVLCG